MKPLRLQLAGSYKQLPQLTTKIKALGHIATPCESISNLTTADYILFFEQNEGFAWLRNNPNAIEKAILCTPNQIVIMRNKGEWYRFCINSLFQIQILTIENIINAVNTLAHKNLSSWEVIQFSPELARRTNKVITRKPLNMFHNVENDHSKNKTIHELFEEQVFKTPNNIAVTYEGKGLSYYELSQRVKQLSLSFKKEAKTAGTDPISSGLSRSEILTALLSVLKVETSCHISMDNSYLDDKISYILSDSGVKVVLNNNLPRSIN